ncbi:hypothetical protein ACHQM5_022705 [Ranunculus cassubicifolius]
MAAERESSNPISVKLNGSNYSYWSYLMRNFLKGKKLWGYVSGILTQPTNDRDPKYAELFDIWDVNNAKIITWINLAVETSIGIQLAKYDRAKDVWDHLAKVFTQSNFAKQYQLEGYISVRFSKVIVVFKIFTLL